MIIVDSTVWIDYLGGFINPHTDWLDRALLEPLGLTDLILCEVLQGIRDEFTFRRIRREFSRFTIFPTGGEDLAIASAQTYRFLRTRGHTVRKTIDCLLFIHSQSRASGWNPLTDELLSIPRHRRIDVPRPGIDSAAQ
jgi:predicted nucleic acid-binding protein